MKKITDLTPRQRKLAIGLAAAAVFYLLFGFVAMPFILRWALEKKVAAAIKRQVAVEAVRVNPLTLSVTLRGLDVHETGGAPFVKLGEAYVNLQTVSLFKWALVLKRVRLVNPAVNLVRVGETTFNFSDIGQGRSAAPASAPDTSDQGGGVGFVIEDFQLSGGRIALEDRVAAVNHLIEQLALGVTDLSSRPKDVDRDTLFTLAARINAADFSLSGKTRPFKATRETLATLALTSVQLPHYLPYIRLPKGLALRSLTADLKNAIDFKMDEKGKPGLTADGTLALHDLQLTDGSGAPFFNQQELRVELQPSALLAGQVRLAKVDLTAPEMFLERLASGALRLPVAPASTASAPPAAEAPAKAAPSGALPPVITVDHLNLEKGVVHFSDHANSTAFTTTVSDLGLTVENFGLNTDRTAKYRLSLKTDAGETLTLQGDASLAPLQATGEVKLTEVKIPRYAPYYQDRFAFKTLAGALSLGGNYRFHQEKEAPVIALAGLHLALDGFTVVRAADDDPLFSLGKLQVADTDVDVNGRSVTIGRVDVANAEIACRRETDGSLNLTNAFTPSPAAVPSAAAVPATAPPSPAAPGAPWVVNLNALHLAETRVAVEDRVPKAPVKFKMEKISLAAESLSTAADHTGKAELSLKWEKSGQLQVGGKVSIMPLSLDLTVKAKQMDVRPFQPYLSEQAGLIVTQGFFNTQGQLKLGQNKKAEPVIVYRGQAGLNRFASIDRQHSNDFLKWEALLLDNLDVGVNPTRLTIKQIALSDFFARVIVDPKGNVNLVTMFAPPGDQTATEKKTAAAKSQTAKKGTVSSAEKARIKIDRFSMSGGEVDFSDDFIKPHFRARFHDLGGKVSGLESMAEKRADVLLEGLWAKQAPVKITGQINPLIANPYVDLNLNISDIELSPFSPYSGKYLGYIIDKGKLTFNVAYLMEDRRLEGKNSIYIDQLTLGNTVESPQAVKLPIKLAIALLKDRSGNIALDLPVSGNLDDPQFKIGKLILTVLKNLIVKIVTSPFAVLGALAGGGEELRYLDFAPGASDISAENAEKIDKVAKILRERPGLKLDIQGTANPQADGDALRAILLENRLKGAKLEQMMKKGKSAVPLEEIQLEADERTGLIESTFADSGIAVPLDNNGKPVQLTPEEMEKLLRTNTEVTPDDYRNLANARAFSVKNELLEKGKVARERVFVVEPKAVDATGSQKEGSRHGQVVFSLK